FFFFQAEDGIRDKLVTGVQTCALPISAARISTPGRTCASGSRRTVADTSDTATTVFPRSSCALPCFVPSHPWPAACHRPAGRAIKSRTPGARRRAVGGSLLAVALHLLFRRR